MKITRRAALKSSALAATALALRGPRLFSQAATGVDAHIDILPGEPIGTISPEIYSHFIEHRGGVIYDGVWVGPDSKIANTNGIRQAFIDTMKAVQAPVLRWPGGCFADSYDWRDGIGPNGRRPPRTGFWGQQDSNQYGLHEFMHTCRAIGCKPYLAADLRTLPARDFYQEIEYCNAPAGNVPSNSAAPALPNALAAQRAANGDVDPFNVDLWGVGNESWGCGGNLSPEEYAAEFRKFTAWTPSYSRTPNRFVAVGPNGDDVDWTRRLFKSLFANSERRHLFGLSVHYYTSGSPTQFAAGDALNFSPDDFYDLLTRGSIMERVVTDHWSAMGNTSEPGQPQVKLVVDEWGAWYGKGTALAPEYNLSQQSTMRDALLTGITLDIFQRHADKVAVANVAQSINCIHSLMLAQGDKFTVTPTFHVFQMYLPHRGARGVLGGCHPQSARQRAHPGRRQQLHRIARSSKAACGNLRFRVGLGGEPEADDADGRKPAHRPPRHHGDRRLRSDDLQFNQNRPRRSRRPRAQRLRPSQCRPPQPREYGEPRSRAPYARVPTSQRHHAATHAGVATKSGCPIHRSLIAMSGTALPPPCRTADSATLAYCPTIPLEKPDDLCLHDCAPSWLCIHRRNADAVPCCRRKRAGQETARQKSSSCGEAGGSSLLLWPAACGREPRPDYVCAHPRGGYQALPRHAVRRVAERWHRSAPHRLAQHGGGQCVDSRHADEDRPGKRPH